MIERARNLRKNATDAEDKLWSLIRSKQFNDYKFRRQYIISFYIVDFICIERKIIIELDGSQHLETIEYDQERTDYLNSKGYHVLRFWNNEILKNINGVLENILDHLLPPP